MPDTLNSIRELRFLEDKRSAGSLSSEEEARWRELRALVHQDSAPAAGGGSFDYHAQPSWGADGTYFPPGFDVGGWIDPAYEQAYAQGYIWDASLQDWAPVVPLSNPNAPAEGAAAQESSAGTDGLSGLGAELDRELSGPGPDAAEPQGSSAPEELSPAAQTAAPSGAGGAPADGGAPPQAQASQEEAAPLPQAASPSDAPMDAASQGAASPGSAEPALAAAPDSAPGMPAVSAVVAELSPAALPDPAPVPDLLVSKVSEETEILAIVEPAPAASPSAAAEEPSVVALIVSEAKPPEPIAAAPEPRAPGVEVAPTAAPIELSSHEAVELIEDVLPLEAPPAPSAPAQAAAPSDRGAAGDADSEGPPPEVVEDSEFVEFVDEQSSALPALQAEAQPVLLLGGAAAEALRVSAAAEQALKGAILLFGGAAAESHRPADSAEQEPPPDPSIPVLELTTADEWDPSAAPSEPAESPLEETPTSAIELTVADDAPPAAAPFLPEPAPDLLAIRQPSSDEGPAQAAGPIALAQGASSLEPLQLADPVPNAKPFVGPSCEPAAAYSSWFDTREAELLEVPVASPGRAAAEQLPAPAPPPEPSEAEAASPAPVAPESALELVLAPPPAPPAFPGPGQGAEADLEEIEVEEVDIQIEEEAESPPAARSRSAPPPPPPEALVLAPPPVALVAAAAASGALPIPVIAREPPGKPDDFEDLAPVPVPARPLSPFPAQPAMAQPAMAQPRPTPRPIPAAPRMTPSPMPAVGARAAPAPAPNASIPGEHRVVVHTLEGQVKRGTVRNPILDGEQLDLEVVPGQPPERIATRRLKAVFFLLPPGSRGPSGEGPKLRVTFSDERQVTGFAPNYRPSDNGFFVIPTDTRTNTARIYIYRAAVKNIARG